MDLKVREDLVAADRPEWRSASFAIAQEALQNVARHSAANAVQVMMSLRQFDNGFAICGP